MSTINLGQITLDDALNDPDPLSFEPRVRPPLTVRITCRVCDRTEEVPILSAGLLCGLCRADLDATEQHIRDALAAAEGRLQNAIDAWDAAYAQATTEDQARYLNVCDARVWPGDAEYRASFARKYARALARGDGLSALLRAKEACDATAQEVQGKLYAWAYAALEEVKEARDVQTTP